MPGGRPTKYRDDMPERVRALLSEGVRSDDLLEGRSEDQRNRLLGAVLKERNRSLFQDDVDWGQIFEALLEREKAEQERLERERCDIIDIVDKKKLSADAMVDVVGEISKTYETEQEFVRWLLRNKHVLEEVIGLVPDDRLKPIVNAPLMRTKLRPDIVYRTHGGCLHIIEAKNTRAKYASQSMTAQVAALSQLLLYRAVCGDIETKLFLIDTCIHKETVVVVQQNNLPIALIQAKQESWIARLPSMA